MPIFQLLIVIAFCDEVLHIGVLQSNLEIDVFQYFNQAVVNQAELFKALMAGSGSSILYEIFPQLCGLTAEDFRQCMGDLHKEKKIDAFLCPYASELTIPCVKVGEEMKIVTLGWMSFEQDVYVNPETGAQNSNHFYSNRHIAENELVDFLPFMIAGGSRTMTVFIEEGRAYEMGIYKGIQKEIERFYNTASEGMEIIYEVYVPQDTEDISPYFKNVACTDVFVMLTFMGNCRAIQTYLFDNGCDYHSIFTNPACSGQPLFNELGEKVSMVFGTVDWTNALNRQQYQERKEECPFCLFTDFAENSASPAVYAQKYEEMFEAPVDSLSPNVIGCLYSVHYARFHYPELPLNDGMKRVSILTSIVGSIDFNSLGYNFLSSPNLAQYALEDYEFNLVAPNSKKQAIYPVIKKSLRDCHPDCAKCELCETADAIYIILFPCWFVLIIVITIGLSNAIHPKYSRFVVFLRIFSFTYSLVEVVSCVLSNHFHIEN